MISRLTVALPIAALGCVLLAAPASAQRRGMGGSPLTRGIRGSAGQNRPFAGPREGRHRFLDDSAFFPFFYFDDGFGYEDEYEPPPPEAPPVQVNVAQPAQPPTPAASPVDSLLLENRDGQWVRIPTGSQIPIGPQSVASASAPAPAPRPGNSSAEESAQPEPPLPHAVLVFRDGHMEEVGRYMIQGDSLYTSADFWSTGSWNRKIPIADLNLPASLKLNQDRGAKFELPTAPNHIVIRF